MIDSLKITLFAIKENNIVPPVIMGYNTVAGTVFAYVKFIIFDIQHIIADNAITSILLEDMCIFSPSDLIANG